MASDNVQVVIRVRPLITREKIDGSKALWQTRDDVIFEKSGSHQYRFDKVFSQDHDTEDVYEHVLPIIKACMDGFNGTVFAYGQTASGKTYTMTGDMNHPGIIPLTVEEVFNTIENTLNREFLIRVSFMEIYNENVVDLLGDLHKHLEVREDTTKGHIFVDGLTEEIVTSPDKVMLLLRSGENQRHYGSTSMNERSSRSHTIFRLIIESRQQLDNTRTSIDQNEIGAINVSTLNLVDLAGSEKAKHTHATGQRLAEGGFINKSLLHLSSVISQLSENANFISYRDSRLTRILQNSLGGNSKTAIICNVTPAAIDETLSTLRFATSAKRIKNKPKINEVLSDDAMLKRYKKEITALKKTLKEMKKTDVGVVQEEKMELELKLEEEKRFRQEQESQINNLTKLICVSSRSTGHTPKVQDKRKRRETWCPGKARKSLAAGLLMSQANQVFLREQASTATKPSLPMSRPRRECSFEDTNLSFTVMPSSVQEIIGEENEDSADEYSSLERVPRPINFDESCLKMKAPVCDMECQTEDWLGQVDSDDEKIQLLLQLEAFKGDIEGKDEEISALRRELLDKETELNIMNSALDKQLEQENTLSSEIYELTKQLKERPDSAAKASRESDVSQSSDVEAEMAQRIEQLEQANLDLQDRVNEAYCISQNAICDLEAANSHLEEMRQKHSQLEEDYRLLNEEFNLQEEGLQELEEFKLLSEELTNMSILEKQEAKKRLSSLNQHPLSPEKASDTDITKLHKQVAELKKDCVDAETICLDTKKQLACSQDETKLIDQEYRELKDTVFKLEKEIQRLENEKQDFDLILEMEAKKYKRRESELTDQLSSAYGELGNGRKSFSSGTKENEELEKSLENSQQELTRLREEQKNHSAEIQSYKDTLNELEELQENLGKAEIKSQELEIECSELKDDRQQLEETINLLKEELQCQSTSMEALEGLKVTNENLSLEVERLKEELESQKQSVADSEKLQIATVDNVCGDVEEKIVSDLDAELRLKEELASQRQTDVESEKLKTSAVENICDEKQDKIILDLKAELQAMQASLGVCRQCRMKIGEVSLTELNQTADCSYIDRRMGMMLSARPTGGTSSKPSLFDEMAADDMTVGLSGMFPQRVLDDTVFAATDSELEAAASAALVKELQQELECQLKQSKDELSAAKEREGNMMEMKEMLERERDALKEQVEGQMAEIEGLRKEINVINGSNTENVGVMSEEISEELEVTEKTEETDVETYVETEVRGEMDEKTHTAIDHTEESKYLSTDEASVAHGAEDQGRDWRIEKSQLLEEYDALKKQLEDVEQDNASLGEKVHELQNSVDELGQKLQLQIASDGGEASFQKKVMEIRDLAMDKLEEAKGLYKREQDQLVNKLTVTHRKEVEALIEEHRAELEQLREGHERIIEQLREDHTEELSKAGSNNSINSELAEQIMEKQKKEINSLQEELSVAENVMVMKESELEAFEEKYTETVQRLKDEMHESQAILNVRHRESMEDLKNKHKAECEELREQLNKLCEEYNKLLDTKESQGERVDIENALRTVQLEKEDLVLKLEDVQLKVQNLLKEKTDLDLKYLNDTETLKEEMKVFRIEKESQLEVSTGQISELESQLNEVKEEVRSVCSTLEEKREELEFAVQEKDGELAEKDKLIADGRGMLQKLQTELDRLKETLQDSEVINKEKLSELESEKCSLRLDIEKYSDEITQLRSQVSDTYCVNEEVDRLKQSLQEVREEREVATSEKKTVQEEVTQLNGVITELESELAEEKRLGGEFQEKIEMLESTITKGYTMLSQCEQETQEMQDECDKMREEKEQLEQKYEDLMDKYDSHLEEIRTDHESEIQTYTDRNTELQSKYDTLCEEYEQMKVQLETSNQETLEKHLTHISSLEQQIEELHLKGEEDQLRLNQEMLQQTEKLDGEVRDAKMECSAQSRKLEALAIQKDNDLMELELKLQREVSKKEEALRQLQAEADTLKDQVNTWKEQVTLLETEIQRQQKALESKEEELGTVRSELQECEDYHTKEEDKLKGMIDEVEDELEQAKKDCASIEREFENFKKKQIAEVSMSFSNAEGKYQKKLEMLKQQYEEEINRLRRQGSDTHSDLNASVCQLREEKSRMSSLQDAVMKKEKEIQALKVNLQKSNQKLQELHTDVREIEQAAEEREEYLKGCVDSAEIDLDKKTSECYRLEDEIERLQKAQASQENTETLAKVEAERDEFRRQLGDKKMQLVMLNAELMKVADPLKREIKYLKTDNGSLREQVQRFKNEVRRLKNNQQDDSVVCERAGPPQSTAGSGVVHEVIRFSLEAEKKTLEREVERLKKTNEGNKFTILELKQQICDKDTKLARYKKYYKKQLTVEEKSTLQDIVNSPRPETVAQKSRRSGENQIMGAGRSSENWLNMDSWLVKDSKQTTFSSGGQEEAGQCKQQ